MSPLRTMSKEYGRGLIFRLIVPVYIISIFCCCLLPPICYSGVADVGSWGLIIGAALFVVMVVIVPLLGAGFIVYQRNRALDEALTPLGLQGQAHDIVWRAYHGRVGRRDVTARFYRGPSFELGVSIPTRTRAAISPAAVIIPRLAQAFNYQPLPFVEPELADLSISGLDEAWLRQLLSAPEVRAAVGRLTQAAADWAALQQVIISPTGVKLWLYRNKNLWRYDIRPAETRQWLEDLLLLAQAIAELPVPREPLAESAFEEWARSDWSQAIWVMAAALLVGLPLCGALIAGLLLALN
jgi:hypothetical protein